MLKITGILLVLSGCMCIGFTSVRRFNQRIEILRSMAEAFELLGYEMEFHMSTLKDAFKVTAKKLSGQSKKLFHSCAVRMEKELEGVFCDVWSQEVLVHLSQLKEYDIDCIKSVGAVLGRYEIENQLCALRAAIAQLKILIDDAVKEKTEKGRVCSVLSVAVGLFIIVILL